MSDEFVINVDGACSGNPGPAAIGVVIRKNNDVIKEVSRSIGEGTNNIAEYSALICALEEAKILKAQSLTIYTDSELVFKQVTGQYKVKHENMKTLCNRVKQLIQDFSSVDLQHVLREKNKEADKLASSVLKHKSVV